jgi:hypothetical protein
MSSGHKSKPRALAATRKWCTEAVVRECDQEIRIAVGRELEKTLRNVDSIGGWTAGIAYHESPGFNGLVGSIPAPTLAALTVAETYWRRDDGSLSKVSVAREGVYLRPA